MWRARGNDNIITINNTRDTVDNIDGYKLFGMWDNPHAHRVFISRNVYRYSIPVILRTLHFFSLFSQNYEFFVSSRFIRKKPILQICDFNFTFKRIDVIEFVQEV